MRTGPGVPDLAACAGVGDEPAARDVAAAIRRALAGDLPGPLFVEGTLPQPAYDGWFDTLISARRDDRGQLLGATITPMRADAEIRVEVVRELARAPRLADADAIAVAVQDGAVTLTGHAADCAEKLAADRVAARVPGVRRGR